jgi:hypothetical protein
MLSKVPDLRKGPCGLDEGGDCGDSEMMIDGLH